MHYPRWIRTRLQQRRRAYLARAESGLFSLITPVYDTEPRFLLAMAKSVFAQDFSAWEWVLVDNGSSRPETVNLLARIARDPRVRLLRLEPNQGIMGGTRHAVLHASGRYLLPVDSDDILYPDALRVMASVLQAHDYPALAYSDEDKLLPNGRVAHPFLKPDWDPVLFTNCCYVAHLCAIDREIAAEVGAYTDDAAHGCHDWDTFWRFVRAGHEPLHVPEVLYSWRMHAGSTATPDASPKPYTLGSQFHVLTNHVHSQGLDERIEVRVNPLFRNLGLWRTARKAVDAVPMQVLLHATCVQNLRRCLHALAQCVYPQLHVHVIGRGAAIGQLAEAWHTLPGSAGLHVQATVADSLLARELRDLLDELAEDAPVAILADEVTPLTLDWPWEALGLLELHPDVVVVGARIVDEYGTTLSAGEYFGVNGLLGSPDRGRLEGDFGPYGVNIAQRCVDVVPAEFCVARASFLRTAIKHARISPSLPILSAWLGALARCGGKRVAWSPHIVGQCRAWDSRSYEPRELAAFRAEFGELPFGQRYYSRHYCQDTEHAYHLASPAHLAAGEKLETCSSASIRA
jgi:hypothetical protein